ncbi:unnamed protein product [Pylaiella littoralis]
MSSKLDYLKKYGTPGGGEDGKKKKRRKKTPGAKDAKNSARSGGGGDGLRIIDDEAGMTTLDNKKVDKAWEGEETEEEKPALVLDDPDAGKKTQSGSWTTVGVASTSTAENDGEDVSPPRRRRRHDSSDGGEDASPPRRNPKNGSSGGNGVRRGGGDNTGGAGDASPPRRRRRHDSSDEEDASPPRRNGRRSTGDAEDSSPPRRQHQSQRPGATTPVDGDGDTSPPGRRARADDDSRGGGRDGDRRSDHGDERGTGRRSSRMEDASPPRRQLPSGGRGDRDGDSSPPRRGGTGARGSSSRHNRSSSPENKTGHHRRVSSPPRSSRRSKTRHDSSSGDDDEVDPIPLARGKEARGDASPPRRKKRGGGGGMSDESPPRRGRRRDSSFPKEEGGRNGDTKRRRRHDSPESGKAGGGDGGKSDGGGGVGDDRVKTSSGYYAGLQSGKDFKVVEQNMKRKHEAEMKGADQSNSGQGAETVYRDKKGRKLDMLNEFMKSQDARAGKKVEEAKEQFAWGRGKVQKEEEKQWKEELENIAAEPFARTVDDTRLEEARKAEIRADDPMAAYMAKKKVKERVKSGKPLKPEYKGPQPKPNRFGIRPGYRWDGNDRGNGWEARIVAKGVDNNYKAELAYKWATADM